ncbi:acyl-ACP--UDP-N-acetylglucosamine O-acyltransferase [Aliikangiella coralliicola]|uniref:Acyl-[acyl-carrier-protein]--UDP-N-acetylglucosamine O-acyltransferase n=1 Tax=Aliikangiella coralliicola TaxID=2592383 RepID=A0A545UB26_9GAMM|nr:acyl-ACP--UDP-N-acetylglucosamine O-acyltransferase [Aliikangiella coralliicola]TQV86633.1 acyl-ACP--UDP-N-acetylglucosamine O-acyltransferase [Aliikangiella coralliicola]
MIHPSAVIHPSAQLADNVSVGPFSVIEENVSIDEGTIVGPHVVINGHTQIGKNNHFYQFCSVGEANQDKKYKGEPTRTVIGDDNTIRESCTIHRGTAQDREETTIGNGNLLMAYTHIAHDCVLGNNVTIANSSNLAGHVVVGDWAILGGFSGIHQFCHIGEYAFVGIRSTVTQDIAPFVLYAESAPRSVNTEGLRRRGFHPDEVALIRKAYRIIYRKGLLIEQVVEELTKLSTDSKSIQLLVNFIKNSKRGLARGPMII